MDYARVLRSSTRRSVGSGYEIGQEYEYAAAPNYSSSNGSGSYLYIISGVTSQTF